MLLSFAVGPLDGNITIMLRFPIEVSF